MDVAGLVAATVAAAQIVKKMIEKATGHAVSTIVGTVIACVVGTVVVAFKAIEVGVPFDATLLILWIQVLILAVGGFKVAKALFPGDSKK